MKPASLGIASALLALAVVVPASAQGLASERNTVTIALMQQTALDDTVIYLNQIARLSGGPIALRQRIARLDVAEFRIGADRTLVSCEQIKYRLLLAGVQESQFQMIGARRTMVSASGEPLTMRKVLAAADDAIRSRYANVGAVRDLVLPPLDVRATDRVHLEAKTPILQAGGVSAKVDVLISVNGQPREIVPVSFDMDARAPAPGVASRVDSSIRQAVRVEPKKNEPVIRTRDLVRIVAPIGNAQLTASGEAQQDGKLGDVIRVRNIDSNRIVSGRVEAPGIVVADY
jgi:hypothetical protein